MKNNFAFLQVSEVISGIITLPREVKEKKSPFIIVNSDNDRGLYIKKLEQEIAKYKGLKSNTGEEKFYEVETNDLIVFGDSPKFDYSVQMNNINLISLTGRNVKVFDLVSDYDKIVRRLSTYCSGNGIKRKAAYNNDATLRVRIVVEDAPKPKVSGCPLLRGLFEVETPKVQKTLVNVYRKPDVSVEKITVHSNWVKIGYNQYDIFVDMFGNEFIVLEDGDKMFVKADRFCRKYLTT